MTSIKRLHPSSLRLRLGTASALLTMATVLLAVLAIRSAQAQTFTVLYRFKGAPDGQSPWTPLARDADGNLYGTTGGGGAYGYGTVFKINKCGKETVLYSFAGAMDGAYPSGGLLRDAEGNLYGTTNSGGYPDCNNYGCGTVFKVDKHGKESVLYRFGGMPDGAFPESETLLLDEAGNLYGTTGWGGDNNCDPGQGCGTVFKLDKNGRETILHTFTGIEELDGASPYGGLVSDAKGNLYSTTSWGGAPGCSNGGSAGCGTVFKLDKTGKETVLHRFSGWLDGGPGAGVIQDNAGNLYGIAGGGTGLDGRVFKLNKCDKETVLYNFSGFDNSPSGGLARDGKGNFYGTTATGGNRYEGTVYKLAKSGKMTILYTFSGGADGGFPAAPLIMDEDGNLYGTARDGGNSGCNYGCGVVFKITPHRAETDRPSGGIHAKHQSANSLSRKSGSGFSISDRSTSRLCRQP